MPRVSKVSRLGLDYGFLFDIQNYEDLQGWWDNVRSSIGQKDFAQATQYALGKAHANYLAQLAEMKGIGAIEVLVKINEDLGRGLDKVLREAGRLFINNQGGYFGYSKDLTITDTREVDVWALPTESVRIIQWSDGKHFYAKIGNEDVVVNGAQKWDTRKDAEAAAQKYVAGKRR